MVKPKLKVTRGFIILLISFKNILKYMKIILLLKVSIVM
jgi:hypothetical protein